MSLSSYTGWPIKNGMAYFSQYVDAITSVSVLDNFSQEKWYQDQQFWYYNSTVYAIIFAYSYFHGFGQVR